jgi:hypothetical protein
MSAFRQCPKKGCQSRYGDTLQPKEEDEDDQKSWQEGVSNAMRSRNLHNDEGKDIERERWRLGFERYPRM